jgi:hypothetical protein
MNLYAIADEERIHAAAQVHEWTRSGLLDASQGAAIETGLHTDLKRTNRYLRVALFIFGTIVVVAAFGFWMVAFGVSRESVGRFREVLPQAVQSMIETVTAPEMALLGYATSQPVATALTHYRDPFANIHTKFPADYSADAGRVRDELERLERLTAPAVLSDDEARRWFVYPEAYRRLREAVRPH